MSIFIKIRLLTTLLFIPIFCFTQKDSSSVNNIAIIELTNGKEIRGVIIHEDDLKIALETGKNKITEINRIKISSIKIINRSELKNKKEFDKESTNYSQNCFLPSAYINSKNKLSFNSHYNSSYNLKLGLNKNFELNAGGVALIYNYIGVCYSLELVEFLHFGTTVFGSYLLPIDTPESGQFGTIIIPRFTIGNKNRNITIGFVGASIQNFNNWIYGGYFGAQRRIHERWVIAGELTAINLDTYNYLYLGNVIAKLKTNTKSNWNFGIVGFKFPDLITIFPNDIPFLPIPYVGYSRNF